MTTGEARKCPNCGASATRAAARFCEYCGSELPRPPGASRPEPSPRERAEERFAALEAHPETARWMEHVPPSGRIRNQLFQSVFGLLALLAVGSVVTLVFFTVCPPLGFVPLALVILLAIAMSKRISTTAAASGAPLERLPALVVDERTKITGGGRDSAARTQYFVTLQLRDGSRRELDVSDDLAGEITQGDAGIAFVQGGYLIDFGRVPV